MRRIAMVLGLGVTMAAAGLALGAPTVVTAPLVTVPTRTPPPPRPLAPMAQNIETLNARWLPLVKAEHRPKVVALGQTVYELARNTPVGHPMASSEAFERHLREELAKLGITTASETLAALVLAMTSGGTTAMATAQNIAAQLAGLRAVDECKGDAACVKDIKPTSEMTLEDLSRAKKRIASEKRPLRELIAADSAALKEALVTKARFEKAIAQLASEADAGAAPAP